MMIFLIYKLLMIFAQVGAKNAGVGNMVEIDINMMIKNKTHLSAPLSKEIKG